jgi:hypothetical protein
LEDEEISRFIGGLIGEEVLRILVSGILEEISLLRFSPDCEGFCEAV